MLNCGLRPDQYTGITLEEVSGALRTALEQALDPWPIRGCCGHCNGPGQAGGLVTDRQHIETVDEVQAHLEALRELAEKRVEKNAEVTELRVGNRRDG